MAKRYKDKKNWTKWIYWFTFAVAVIFVYKTLDNFNSITTWFGRLVSVLMPFILAILLAYVLYIPCRFFERLYKKIKILNRPARPLSVFTVYIIIVLIIVLLVNIILPAASASVKELANNLPIYYNNAKDYVNNIPDDSIIKKESIQQIINNLQTADITKMLSLDNITSYINKAIGIASTILEVFVTILVSIYILLERRQILEFLRKMGKALFKPRTNEAFGRYFLQSNEVFFKFLSSQILDGIVIGTIMSIAMWIMGVKYGILLGIMIGVLNLIPFFGPIIGIFIAAVITFFTGGISQALWFLVIAIVLHQIDAHVINPKIVGTRLKISPILVIFAIIVVGAYFGVLGMFLAVPIIAVIKILLNDFLDYRIEKKKEILQEE